MKELAARLFAWVATCFSRDRESDIGQYHEAERKGDHVVHLLEFHRVFIALHFILEGLAMNKLILALAATIFSVGAAFAQAPAASSGDKAAAPKASTTASASSCEAKAVGKNGKPLAGAAKSAFMKKCEGGNQEGKASSCETKAVGKNGKPLAGAAKTAFMKKCEADSAK